MKSTHSTPDSGSTPDQPVEPRIITPAPLGNDEKLLLLTSVTDTLNAFVDGAQLTEPHSLEELTADAMNALGIQRRVPQPSAPTTFMGAPDLGRGWSDPDSRHAFGEA